ncbi:hypothetical protein A4X06_0g9086, partial [Tilletia controversa]
MGTRTTVYRAEATALHQVLVTLPTEQPAYVWSDSRALLLAINAGLARDPMIRAIQDRWRDLGDIVKIGWIPGHWDIVGNEGADERAKEAARMECEDGQDEAATLRLAATRRMRTEWERRWEEGTKGRAKPSLAHRSPSLDAVRVAQLEKRRAADTKVAAFLDRFVRDLADLESRESINTDACRLFTAAAEAALAQALTPNARAPPDQLIKALRTWNPENAASADSIRLPDSPRSYATAARKDKGKASSRRPAPETIIPPTPPAPLRPLQGFRLRGQRSGSAEEAAAAADSRADDRLFARLSSQHELRTKHAYFLKKMLTDALSESGAPATIGLYTIKHVPSGLALRPSDTCTASELFEYHDLIKETLSADKVDISNQWHRYVLMNVPCFIDGEQVPDNIIADELEAALDCPLAEPPRRLGRPDALSLQRSSSVLFFLPRGRMPVGTQRLTVLGQRFSVRMYKEQKASENCDKCLSQHHTTAACTALQPRCKSCGVEGHEASSDDCRIAKAAPDTADAVPLCYHCHGPHPAFFTGCYAAARYSKEVRAVTVPTGTRLARARKDGQRRRHQEIARQRVAAMARSSRTAQE